MIDIVTADRGHIRHVLNHLRLADREEMEACDIDLNALPDIIMRHKLFAYAACSWEYGPISIWGAVPRRSWVCAAFAFGTDNWGHALLPMVRQIRGFVIPYVAQSGIHRVEAAALATRDDVARFMRLIGARPEGLLRGYGSGGEDFTSYRWLVDEYDPAGNTRKAAPEHSYTTH